MSSEGDFVFSDLKNVTKEPCSYSTVRRQEWDPTFFNNAANLRYSINEYSEATLVTKWTIVQTALKDGFSPSSLLEMVKIAFQLKNPDNTKGCILGIKAYDGPGSTTTNFAAEDSLSTTKYPRSTNEAIAIEPDAGLGNGDDEGGDDVQALTADDIAVSAPYVCCTLLRMLKKDPRSYILSLDNIRKNYNQFYKTPSPLVNRFTVDKATAEVIGDVLSNDPIINHTVIYYLNAMSSTLEPQSNASGLVRYLLAQHLEFKGLSTYRLFVDCYKHVKKELTPAVFLSWLMNDATERGVLEIADVLRRYDNVDSKEDRGFFSYARYLLPGAFFDIHINNAPVLSYALAVLLRDLTKQDDDEKDRNNRQNDPTQIAAFKRISNLDKKDGKELAEMFITCLRERKQVHKKAGFVQQRVQEKTHGIKRSYKEGILVGSNTAGGSTLADDMETDFTDLTGERQAKKQRRNADEESLLDSLGA